MATSMLVRIFVGEAAFISTFHQIIPKISVPHSDVTMLKQQISNMVVEIFVLIMEAR